MQLNFDMFLLKHMQIVHKEVDESGIRCDQHFLANNPSKNNCTAEVSCVFGFSHHDECRSVPGFYAILHLSVILKHIMLFDT